MRKLIIAALVIIVASSEARAQDAWQLRAYTVAAKVGCVNEPNMKAFHEWVPRGSQSQLAELKKAVDRDFPGGGKEFVRSPLTAEANSRSSPVVGLVQFKSRCKNYNRKVVGEFTHYVYYTGKSREAVQAKVAETLKDPQFSGGQIQYLDIRKEIEQARKETAAGKRFTGFTVRN